MVRHSVFLYRNVAYLKFSFEKLTLIVGTEEGKPSSRLAIYKLASIGMVPSLTLPEAAHIFLFLGLLYVFWREFG